MLFNLRSVVFFLLLATTTQQVVVQAPFFEPNRSQERIDAIKRDSFFIFNSLLHLFRQWGTTLAPNGFSFTYAVIPAHTPLYHARKTSEAPNSPEWFAFDYQMSLGIKLTSWGETFLRIYTSKRPLKVLYIDGLSATLTATGSLDSQDILLYGKVLPDMRKIWDDYGRAENLCSWAKKHDIEGFIRTNAGFEVIWCDFDTGVELSQNLNVSDWYTIITGQKRVPSPWGPGGPPTRPMPPTRRPTRLPTSPPPGRREFSSVQHWEWLRSATENYSGMGEERAILDTSRLVTAYGEVGVFPTLDPDMSKHRLANMTRSAASFYRSEIERISNPSHVASGVNWRKIADSIATRYGQRLPEIRGYLANGTEPALKKARLVTISLLMPLTRLNNTVEEDLDQCTRSFTSSIDGEQLSWSEYKLLVAIETVHGEVCRTIYSFYRVFRNPSSPKIVSGIDVEPSAGDRSGLAVEWRDKFLALEKKLDWKMWKACGEVCKADEICYLPIWPLGRHQFPQPGQDPFPLPSLEPSCVNIEWYLSP